MNNHFLRWTLLACLALLFTACQPIRPLATAGQPATAANTYTDGQGFFTVEYPADWVAHGYLFADAPFPSVAIGSHQEIIDLSTAEQLLPADQIGVGLMLFPRAMFAEAGITAETPLAEAAPRLLMAMAGDDAELMAGLIGDTAAEPVTLASGAPAMCLAFDGLTEAYAMTLADLGDGLYLFGSRIQALDHHNPVHHHCVFCRAQPLASAPPVATVRRARRLPGAGWLRSLYLPGAGSECQDHRATDAALCAGPGADDARAGSAGRVERRAGSCGDWPTGQRKIPRSSRCAVKSLFDFEGSTSGAAHPQPDLAVDVRIASIETARFNRQSIVMAHLRRQEPVQMHIAERDTLW